MILTPFVKSVLGGGAVVLAFIGYIPYFLDIFKGKTKPHAFSWLVWGVLTAIAFVGQVVESGGPGAWATGFTALVCFVIFTLALKKGEKVITTGDKASLLGSFLALWLWWWTSDPLGAVILITIIDALGFYPTLRKSWLKPWEETQIMYLLAGLKFVVALFALESYTVVTWLYPASLVILNIGFSFLLFIRKRQLR
jgi:hypothetical protein